MARIRKPGEGVWNIIRFNWHFYAVAVAVVLLLGLAGSYAHNDWRPYALLLLLLVAFPTIVSLVVSYYVYDYSVLYTFDWLNTQALPEPERVVNIHAGFDESSPQLQQKFASAELRVLDFYDPAKHTEISIQRARAACLPYPGTEQVQPETLPLPTGSTDWVIIMLSAHEIRQQAQRIAFLEEARRILHPLGRLVIVEHLRDPANFLAYTIGFLHFYSRATWLKAFQAAGLTLEQEQKITPFISAFILR